MDDKCHNSMFTGVYLGRPSCIRKFRHNDTNHLSNILSDFEGKSETVLVAVEGLYRYEHLRAFDL